MTDDQDAKKVADERAGLVVTPAASGSEEARFAAEVSKSLDETESQAAASASSSPDQLATWHTARTVVEQFRPVPWFIWRLANFVLGRPGAINQLSEGMVFGLRRLMFAAASDAVLGAGTPINNMRRALSCVRPDAVAAVSVIHAISRRLAGHDHERIWRPILEDALLRSQIGFFIGERVSDFGAGRAMLAGFAGRAGLAVLIATGDIDQARSALERMASGEDIGETGLQIYGCEPLQVSAMLLSAAGCGRDAALGTVSYSLRSLMDRAAMDEHHKSWHFAYRINDLLRMGKASEVLDEEWNKLGFTDPQDREQLVEVVRLMLRRGTAWGWLMQ